MKFRTWRVAAIVVLLLLSEAPILTAQDPAQRADATKLNIEELLSYVNKFSIAFIQGVSEKRKNSQFSIGAAETKEIVGHLVNLKQALAKVNDGTSSLGPANTGTDNLQVLQAALECDRCESVNSSARRKEPPKSGAEMSAFLIARCDAVLALIQKPPANSNPKDIVMRLETHMYYLRQITNAYLPS
jgi:hypothetical protein